YLQSRREAMITLLAELVNLDSPSDDKALLDACATRLAAELAARGCVVERVPVPTAGDHLIGRFGGDGTGAGQRSESGDAGPRPAGRRVLLLAHYDTVWPAGEARRRPFRREGRRGYGP